MVMADWRSFPVLISRYINSIEDSSLNNRQDQERCSAGCTFPGILAVIRRWQMFQAVGGSKRLFKKALGQTSIQFLSLVQVIAEQLEDGDGDQEAARQPF